MITVYGASDDLIEIEGDIEEEFLYKNDEDGDLLAFSDGTVLRIRFAKEGIWRITPIFTGSHPLSVKQAPADDDDNYSDWAVIDGSVKWVVQGIAYAP